MSGYFNNYGLKFKKIFIVEGFIPEGKGKSCSRCSSVKPNMVNLQFNEELEDKYVRETMDSGVRRIHVCTDCLTTSMASFMNNGPTKIALFKELVDDVNSHLKPA